MPWKVLAEGDGIGIRAKEEGKVTELLRPDAPKPRKITGFQDYLKGRSSGETSYN